MGISKEGGDRPSNQGLSDFKVLSKGREVGWSIKIPTEPTENPVSPYKELAERLRRNPRRSGVAGGEAHNETYRRLRKLFEKDTTINDKE
jgi:hypothetical protein